MTHTFDRYKEQYRRNLTLAFPVVLTQVGQILTQVADNLMVGRYGGNDPTPLAAVSFGGSVSFLFFIAAIGIAMGMTPLVGELYVQDKHKQSASLLLNGMLFYVILGIATATVQYLATPLLYCLGQPQEVVVMAVPYYRMMYMSMPFVMLFFAFKQFLEGTGNTHAELMATIVANAANIFLNWVFIFGNMGAPEMGAEGAGFATMLARITASVLIVAYFIGRSRYRIYLTDIFNHKQYSWRSVVKLMRMGIPISAQMFLETSAFVGSGIMMGWLGKEAMSANQIAITLGNCAFMIVISIGAATTIRVSHCFGMRDVEQMKLSVRASYHLVLAWNAIAALFFISLRHVIPTYFTDNAEVIVITSTLLVTVAIYQLSDGLQNVSVGVLRGLQDVKVIMPIAIISYWLLNMPVGYLLAFTFHLGPSGLYIGFFFGLSSAAVLMMTRIHHSIKRMERVVKQRGTTE